MVSGSSYIPVIPLLPGWGVLPSDVVMRCSAGWSTSAGLTSGRARGGRFCSFQLLEQKQNASENFRVHDQSPRARLYLPKCRFPASPHGIMSMWAPVFVDISEI